MRENQIYISTDYDRFVFKKGNRDIIPKHVENIASSMEENGWYGSPIEVSMNKDQKFVIEEGQHRYLAAKKTKTPIHFIVGKEKTLYDIGRQNSLVKPWSRENYIKGYAEEGNYSYKRLQNLIEEFPGVGVSDVTEATIGGGYGAHGKLQKGYVRITDEQFYRAREILKYVSPFAESLKKTGIKTKTIYVRAVIHLLKHELISGDRLIEKMNKYGSMVLQPCATKKQAYENIETIYNYRQSKDVVRFMDKVKN